MRIFFPLKKESSFYFDEILEYTTNEFVFGSYKDYSCDFEIVNIHWPESIFNWKEPTLEQLREFELKLRIWKKNSKIIYTIHNLFPHSGRTEIYDKLYNVIAENTDLFIHMGEFSKSLFQEKYPYAKHKILRHPLFEKTYRKIEKEWAREKLGIDKNAIVFISPGRIRNLKERKFVLKFFRSVDIKNKVLLATNMLSGYNKIEFPGKYKLKRWIDINKILEKIFQNRYHKPKYLFNYDFMDNERLSLYMAASDILFVPRIEILNSGLLFLGLTFEKIIIAPSRGNVTEHMKLFQLPIFEPNDFKSVERAACEAVYLLKEGEYVYDASIIDCFKPLNIAFEYDKIVSQILEN